MPRSRSRRTSSISSAAEYSSIRPSGRYPRRSRFSAQISAHISGLVARRPRSCLRTTAAVSESRQPVSRSSVPAAWCQRAMNAATSARLIGSSSSSVNPAWVSQPSRTADGRVVTT